MCNHIFNRGPNKGNKCSIKPREGDFCSKHRRLISKLKSNYSKQCLHCFVKGINKGKQCSVKPRNGDFCYKHNISVKENNEIKENKEADIVIERVEMSTQTDNEVKFDLENEIDREVSVEFDLDIDEKNIDVIRLSSFHGETCDICTGFFSHENDKYQVCPNKHYMCSNCFYATKKAKCPFCRTPYIEEYKEKYILYWQSKMPERPPSLNYPEEIPFPIFNYNNWSLNTRENKEKYSSMDEYYSSASKAYTEHCEKELESRINSLKLRYSLNLEVNLKVFKWNGWVNYEATRLSD